MCLLQNCLQRGKERAGARTSVRGDFMTVLLLPRWLLGSVPDQQPGWFVKSRIRADCSHALGLPVSRSQYNSPAPHHGPSLPLHHHFKDTHSLPLVQPHGAQSSHRAFALALASAWSLLAQVLPLPPPSCSAGGFRNAPCHVLGELGHCISIVFPSYPCLSISLPHLIFFQALSTR